MRWSDLCFKCTITLHRWVKKRGAQQCVWYAIICIRGGGEQSENRRRSRRNAWMHEWAKKCAWKDTRESVSWLPLGRRIMYVHSPFWILSMELNYLLTKQWIIRKSMKLRFGCCDSKRWKKWQAGGYIVLQTKADGDTDQGGGSRTEKKCIEEYAIDRTW